MKKSLRSCLLACAVPVVLAVCVAQADAFRVTFEPAGAVSFTSALSVLFEAGGLQVRCLITLSGSLLRGPIASAPPGSSVGSISSMRWRSCLEGEISATLVESRAPWTLRYEESRGFLPTAVTSLVLGIDRMALNFSILGGFVNCLYSGNVHGDLTVARAERSGVYTSGRLLFIAGETFTLMTLARGGFGCPTTMVVEDITGSTLSPRQTITMS